MTFIEFTWTLDSISLRSKSAFKSQQHFAILQHHSSPYQCESETQRQPIIAVGEKMKFYLLSVKCGQEKMKFIYPPSVEGG